MTLPGPARTLTLADGRRLAWTEVGRPDGAPVLFFHGTPGSRTALVDEAQRIEAADVRLIAPDRPGYGDSTFHHGRRLTDWPGDVSALADHIGLTKFAVAGVSGGGPHAAVCAHHLSARLTNVAIVSGVCPRGAQGQRYPGRPSANERTFRLAVTSPPLARMIFAASSTAMRRWPNATTGLMARWLPPADSKIFMLPEVRANTARQFAGTSPTTARAMTQDMNLFSQHWGFSLEDIEVPVYAWQGDVDRNVPYIHGEYQAAHIPGAVFHRCPGEGHWLIHDHLDEILHAITDQPATPQIGERMDT